MREALLLAVAAIAPCGDATAQELQLVLPAGASRGQELDLECHGKNLDDTVAVVWLRTGLEVTELQAESAERVRLHLRVPIDCELGTYPLRLHTRRGLTRAVCVSIGPLPSVAEAEDHGSPENAQHVALDTTVDARLLGEETDWYEFEAAAGQRVCIEAEGVRLGYYDLDLQFEITAADGALLARADDSSLGRADPIVCFVAPAAGSYRLAVRDVAYRGAALGVYRLHVGTFPRPLGLVPAGGRPGEVVDVRLVGDLADARAAIALPALPGIAELFPSVDGRPAPTPVRVAVDDRPGFVEGALPDDAPAAPCAFHGVIAAAGEEDRFAFRATKGQRIDLRALARTLGSPLDPVLFVRDRDQKQLAVNDDGFGLDSKLRFTAPADGIYLAGVTDQLGRGGAACFYRIEVGERDAGPTTREVVPGRRPEDFGIAVPRGGSNATVLRVEGLDARHGIALAFASLPNGVDAAAARLCDGDVVPIVFSAAPDADGAGLATPTATAEQAPQQRALRHEHTFPILRVDNNQPYATRVAHALPVVVTDALPFAIRADAPKVPLVQNGSLSLPVHIERSVGFEGAVTIRTLWLPPGLSTGSLRLAGRECEGALSLDANDRAAVGEWPIVLVATIDVRGVACTLTTDALRVVVEPPWLTAKLPRTSVEQGRDGTFELELEAKREFAGTVTAELGRVPRGVAAAVPAIDAHGGKLPIRLTAAADAAPGRHTDVFVRLKITTPDGVVVHTAGGGEIRVDVPLPPDSERAGDRR